MDKHCRICGADCAGKPRIKDPQGRYYCKGCYDTAQASETQSEPVDPDIIPLDAPMLEAPAIVPCPSCGNGLPPGTVVCLGCGYNGATGQQAHTVALEPPSVRSTIWPLFIGVISTLLGGFGVVSSVVQVATMASQGILATNNTPRLIGQLTGALFSFSMSLWLMTGGIGVFRRRAGGPVALQRWSVVMLVICGCCTGFTIIAMFALPGTGGPPPPPGTPPAPPQSALLAITAVALVIAMLWPAFLLLWFRRGKIVDEINGW